MLTSKASALSANFKGKEDNTLVHNFKDVPSHAPCQHVGKLLEERFTDTWCCVSFERGTG